LLSAQSQLAADRTLLPDLMQEESVARHALSVLVGEAPADWAVPDFDLSGMTLPGEVAVRLPSELAKARPDIAAAEAKLHMASAEIGVATANLYPHIELSANTTQQALTPGNLFKSVANAWAIAANLTQPLFEGGRLKAERRAAVDQYQAALAEYRQAVLVAFSQVADDLSALKNDADKERAQRASADTAASALALARRSFEIGNSGILDVIDAERRSAEAQLGLSMARAQRYLDLVHLYWALGGSLPQAAPNPAPVTASAD
jgi:NodT family efflux transporter outer membrane factor (OMF) lipoprotein